MPHNIDFTTITNIKILETNPEGWINPLIIEYGLGLHYNNPAYHWRVKGTTHTFVIPIARLEFLSSGDYAQHFSEALKNFRIDYLDWKINNFSEKWMEEYRDEYRKFILV